jgi:hypothetical protein
MRWTQWLHPWTMLAKGMRDGSCGLPKSEHFVLHRLSSSPSATVGGKTGDNEVKLAFLEREVLALAERAIARIAEKWRAVKEGLDGSCNAVRYELERLFERAAVLQTAHITKGLRDPHPDLARGWYAAILVATAAAELVLNSRALAVLRMKEYELYAIAFGPSAMVVIAAHLAGKLIRQGKQTNARMGTGIALTMATVCMVIAIAAVAFLRHDFLLYRNKTANMIDTLALAGLNAVFALGAVLAAIASHDSDSEVERISAEKRALSKRMRKVWGKWNTLTARFDIARARYAEQINGIQTETIARLAEWRRGVAATIESGVIPSWFQQPIDTRLFMNREADFGSEIDAPPPNIEEILRHYGLDRTAPPAATAQNGNGNHRPNGRKPDVPSRVKVPSRVHVQQPTAES